MKIEVDTIGMECAEESIPEYGWIIEQIGPLMDGGLKLTLVRHEVCRRGREKPMLERRDGETLTQARHRAYVTDPAMRMAPDPTIFSWDSALRTANEMVNQSTELTKEESKMKLSKDEIREAKQIVKNLRKEAVFDRAVKIIEEHDNEVRALKASVINTETALKTAKADRKKAIKKLGK